MTNKNMAVMVSALLLSLTACTADQIQTATAVAAGTQAAPASGSVTDPAVTLHNAVQGSWIRVGQLCGTTYTTGLGEQHLAFTDSTMTLSLRFTCDNAVHPAEIFTIGYDGASVVGSMTSSNQGTCPITYANTPGSGTDTFPLAVSGSGTQAVLNVTNGNGCSNGHPQVDVYHKE